MRILIASPIDVATIDRLRADHDVICAFGVDQHGLRSLSHDREVLIFRSGVSIGADLLAEAPALELLLRAGSGTDNIDMAAVHARGLRLVTIPEPGAKAVAEMSFALMLTLARNVLEADRLLRAGHWAKHELTGHALSGKVLGVYGAGNIGSRVGELGSAWGMDVIGCVEAPSPEVARSLATQGVRLTSCHEVLGRADYLSIHVPLTDVTRNLIDAAALELMKPGAFLVNLARGGVVDEKALYSALTEGRLRGAALDVHADEGEGKISPLADLPNVVLTPHIGAGTHDCQREIGERVLSIVAAHEAERRAIGDRGALI